MSHIRHSLTRAGGVYVAVLGTSLIVSVLAFAALAMQRIQNRMLSTSSDVRQAELNATTAIQLGLLAMQQDEDWRTTYNSNDRWFNNRLVDIGTCSLDVIDPIDGDLDDDPLDPVVMTGLGDSGQAHQQIEVNVDPREEPLACLRAAIVAGGDINLTGSTLRTSNTATVAANSVSASSSTVFGAVQGVTVSGSTYAGTTSTVDAEDLPGMPDWSTVFDYYLANGTAIDVNSLPTAATNFARNGGVENPIVSGDPNWSGTQPGVPTAQISQSNNWKNSGSYSLRVTNRADWYAGASQRIDGFVEPGQQYYVEVWVNVISLLSARTFQVSLYTKGSGNGSASYNVGPSGTVISVAGAGIKAQLAGTITAPAWSGDLEYAFVKIGGADVSNTGDFYLDDFVIREATTGRFIYGRTLGPGSNPFGATNPQGIYWIDCSGNKLVIERSRIRGTLLVLNPGSGSCIGVGPINWSPAVPGYPALLVNAGTLSNADFTIAATNRTLVESENGSNFNPAGVSHDQFGEDADANDVYPAEIRGLVAIGDDLVFQNKGLIRGQLIVGGDVTSSGGSLEVDYQPDSLLSPPPGFTGPSSYLRRPVSVRKTVLP